MYFNPMYNRKIQTRSFSQIMKNFVFFLCILFVVTHAQNPAMSQMIRQYIQQGGKPSKAQKMLREYKENKEKSGKDAIDEMAEKDTLADTTSKKKTGQLSVYESMIRGISIDPDQILDSLHIFGHDVFKKSRRSSFSSDDFISVPASYPVSVGDEVIIKLWGRINEEHKVVVDRDGRINIPHMGPVSVAGLPFSAMQKNIIDRVQSIEGVQASVTMGELRSIQIFCMGEVESPGMYTVGALTNVTSALFAAGGPTKNGSLRHIELKRNGKRIKKLDFYNFLLSGNNYTNLRLKSGDVVFVPTVNKMAAIAGNVRQSALYEINDNTSLKDFIGLAGGMTPAAWTNKIQVERYSDNQYQIVLDLHTESGSALPEFAIQDGDIVKIFPIVVKDHNVVYLAGNVSRPGKYELTEGMKINSILGSYDLLLSGTYFEYAVIKRFEPPTFQESIIPFNLSRVLEDTTVTDNIFLKPKDEIYVFHRDFFEPDRKVAIGGAVTNPDDYLLLENMTVRDLIIQAGGLSEDASPERGELYRRTFDQANVTTQKIEFCVQCALDDDPEHNFELNKLDRVFIRSKRGWEEEKKVTLAGEFIYPGTYVLLEGETLGQLIRRAGGFSRNAYLTAAVFTRESVREREKEKTDEYARMLEMDIMKFTGEMASKEKGAEAQALLQQQLANLEKLKAVKPLGRVVINLTNPAGYEHFMLEGSDSLYIPKDISTVSVIGEVYNPSTFKLDNKLHTTRYYIQLAGGYKEHADKRNTYVIKANGTVLTQKMTNVNRYELEPGDAVVVPQRIKYVSGFKVFGETISTLVNITAITTSIATLILLLRGSNNSGE
ncbi:MAG: hypothetical protein GF401_11065 [Chitinivibrionales bacterium]|nr:hypothetical protein [Chitinivibrionales bacterium]